MKTLELCKFIYSNDIEYYWEGQGDNSDVAIILPCEMLEDFTRLLTFDDFEEGLSMLLKNGYIVIYMKELCERHEINLMDVFDIN